MIKNFDGNSLMFEQELVFSENSNHSMKIFALRNIVLDVDGEIFNNDIYSIRIEVNENAITVPYEFVDQFLHSFYKIKNSPESLMSEQLKKLAENINWHSGEISHLSRKDV